MDKSILSKCALGSQKFKERSSPPKDLKANPQLKGRKVWRGTVEARSLRGSRRGALGPSEPDTAWGLMLAQAVWGGVIRVTLRVVVSLATFPPGWFSWEQRWSLPPPEPESEDRASLPACAGCRGTERLMSVTLAVESREGHVRACVCVCVWVWLHQALKTQPQVALRSLAAAGPRLWGQVSWAGTPPATDHLCGPGQVNCLSVPEFPYVEAKQIILKWEEECFLHSAAEE